MDSMNRTYRTCRTYGMSYRSYRSYRSYSWNPHRQSYGYRGSFSGGAFDIEVTVLRSQEQERDEHAKPRAPLRGHKAGFGGPDLFRAHADAGVGESYPGFASVIAQGAADGERAAVRHGLHRVVYDVAERLEDQIAVYEHYYVVRDRRLDSRPRREAQNVRLRSYLVDERMQLMRPRVDLLHLSRDLHRALDDVG